MTSDDIRAQLMPVMEAAEQAVRKEIEETQIVHVPLEEYAVGGERYEKLYAAIALANRFTSPPEMSFNF